jgi:hypothetical protein
VALMSESSAQVVTGLPRSPQPGGRFDLTGAAGDATGRTVGPRAGIRESMALSDDGALLLQSGNGVRLLGGAGGVLFDAPGVLVAFAPNSHDVAIADRQGRSVVVVRDAGGLSEQRLVGQGKAPGLVVGLAFSADGRALFMAVPGGVAVFDGTTGSRTDLACDCGPTNLYRMNGVYRLNEPGAGPLWLLDAASSPMRIVFVPAISE